MALELVTAGESHGPALVAILTGLPAGLTLDREAIDGSALELIPAHHAGRPGGSDVEDR